MNSISGASCTFVTCWFYKLDCRALLCGD